MANFVELTSDKYGLLRAIVTDTDILFCAVDIAQKLGYKRPENAVRAHCTDIVTIPIPTDGGIQPACFITEDEAMYFVARCRLPGAAEFRPALRSAVKALNERFFSDDEDVPEDEDEDELIDDELDELEALAGEVGALELAHNLIEFIFHYISDRYGIDFTEEDGAPAPGEADDDEKDDGPSEEETNRFMDALMMALSSMM